MSILRGKRSVTGIYRGARRVVKVYRGSKTVWTAAAEQGTA